MSKNEENSLVADVELSDEDVQNRRKAYQEIYKELYHIRQRVKILQHQIEHNTIYINEHKLCADVLTEVKEAEKAVLGLEKALQDLQQKTLELQGELDSKKAELEALSLNSANVNSTNANSTSLAFFHDPSSDTEDAELAPQTFSTLILKNNRRY